jgi:hypothetical protein
MAESSATNSSSISDTNIGQNPVPIYSLVRAPKNKTNFFQVKISLRNYINVVTKHDIFTQLLEKHQYLECLVAAHEHYQYKTKYRSPMRIHIVLDTRNMIPDKYSSVDIYHWINEILRNIVGIEQIVPPRNQQIASEVQYIDYAQEISLHNAKRENAIAQATECDFDPCFTALFSSKNYFSENYQIEHWARSAVHKPLDDRDPFFQKEDLSKSIGYVKCYFLQKQKLLWPELYKQCNYDSFGSLWSPKVDDQNDPSLSLADNLNNSIDWVNVKKKPLEKKRTCLARKLTRQDTQE